MSNEVAFYWFSHIGRKRSNSLKVSVVLLLQKKTLSCQIRWRFGLLLLLCLLPGFPGFAYGQNAGGKPLLPVSCGLDFRSTLDAPAGKHGFLRAGDNGHFYFEDGTRARFWGINVSSTRLNISREQIDLVADNFAHAGLNMVRLEAIDNRNCLLGAPDAPDSRHFDALYLDRLDYWMHALRKRGIYYYLDLLDFRTFKSGDNVPNADKLDRGARPYALFNARLIELQKEYASQLLLHRNPYSGLRPVEDPAFALVEICNEHGFFLYPDKLETLAEPYRADLRGMWNKWLLDRYKTRDKLEAAWGMLNGVTTLRMNEDPTQNTTDLPLLTSSPGPSDPNVAEVRRAPNRVRDGVEFLMQTQRAYLQTMSKHLREIGCRIPITGVVSSDVLPDLLTVADTCDFLSENWYGEGIREDVRTPGLRYYGGRNSLRDDRRGGFAPFTAGLRWNRKPVVIREWAVSWPNPFRAASVPEALAYAALQDFDAILLFGYQTNQAPNGAEASALNDFAFQSDPTVWGLYALAGQAFFTRAIQPAVHKLTLYLPPAKQIQWPNQIGELHRAAWCVALETVTAEGGKEQQARTPGGDYGTDIRQLRDYLQTLNRQGAPVQIHSTETGLWTSDTNEITRNAREGRLEIRTPRLCLVTGPFQPDKIYNLGPVQFSTPTRFGTLLVYALDNLPIEKSKHLIVKMVSQAENTGQVLVKTTPGAVGDYVLNAPGKAPVVTLGRKAPQPTRLWLGKDSKTAPLLVLWLENGTWEMTLREGRLTLVCDTPAIQGKAQGKFFTTSEQIVEIPLAPAPSHEAAFVPYDNSALAR